MGYGRACTMAAKADGATPSYHGVCGRHGREGARVTQGGLVSSKRQVWLRSYDTRRRKGGQQGTPTSTWSHQEVSSARSGSEGSAEAVRGVGAGHTTQDRG